MNNIKSVLGGNWSASRSSIFTPQRNNLLDTSVGWSQSRSGSFTVALNLMFLIGTKPRFVDLVVFSLVTVQS
jgi:hypothetical protein